MEEKNQNKMKLALIAVVVIIVAAFGVMQLASSNDDADTSTPASESSQTTEIVEQSPVATVSEDGTLVSYEGETGKTALDLLKELADPTTEDSSFGEFVNAINGVDGGETQYWIFYVNDVAATVGAGEYETMDGESIEWRLE